MSWTNPRADQFCMFRDLNDEEEAQFRQYARDNQPNQNEMESYHPVCRDEWSKQEAAQ